MSLDQHNRPIAITTPLGDNVLGLRSIVVKEELSRPFVIEAQFSSLDPDINFDDIVGHPVVISLTLASGPPRLWHALVSRFSFVGRHEQYFHYQATLVPWLWALTQTADCRIFQDKTIPAIVQEIIHDRGSDDLELRLSGQYPTWNYCVEYRETDFNFVSRLLEQEGIAYHFKHTEEKCMLILGDAKAAYDPLADFAELYYRPDTREERLQDTISSWTVERGVQPTAYSLKDYNFSTPRQSLIGVAQVSRGHALNDGKIFDYPGEYLLVGEGERLAQVRLEELQVGLETVRAETSCLAVNPGCLFTLKEHPRADQNREYLITSAQLYIDAGEFSSDPSASPKAECSFTAIRSEQTFRPARYTAKPIVQGPQTAVVVGPSGEEIHTDADARVKVQFHWDRYGKADENSSCWIRVSHAWAGKNWGAIYTPRIGQEVIVEFLEGDPDRPIITGRVYNGANKAPYTLPDNKTISTTKSNSSKGGAGFNEVRFEDKKGEEQIFVHGEKNQDVRIKNDVYEWVGNDRHLVVKKNQIERVENNRSETVDADHMEKIGKDRHLKVAGKEAKAVDGSLSLTVKGDVIEVFKANHSEQTSADYYLKADNIVIEAMTNITIKVGGSSIAIEAAGIAIKTSGEIKVESTGPTGIKATAPLKLESSAAAEMKSPATTVKGDATTTIKGGMVMIN